jgi:DNA-dependent protein kinase catalytic subunit
MIKSPNEDRPAYTELLYFWKVILGTSNNEQKPAKKEEEKDLVDTEDIEAEDIYQQYQEAHTVDPESLAEALYDSFLTNFMKLIKALNLKVKSIGEKTEEEEHLNTLSKLLQPVNQKDFVLFQNLVEFWCSVLKEIDNTRLAHWVYILSSTMIDLSIINPLVSGFYRILAEILIICETNRFFLGCKTFHSQSNQGSEANISQVSTISPFLIIYLYNFFSLLNMLRTW